MGDFAIQFSCVLEEEVSRASRWSVSYLVFRSVQRK